MKSRSFIGTILLITMLIGLSACKKDIVDNPNNTEYETDVQQFEAVWNGLNTAYVLWPIDTTDWDAVYQKYHPIFESMENEPDAVWASTWMELTSTLIDHHLEIHLERPSSGYYLSPYAPLIDGGIRPGLQEVMKRNYFHRPNPVLPNPNLVMSHLEMLNQLSDVGRLNDVSISNDQGKLLYSGVLDGDIAYIYISSFKGFYLKDIEAFQHFKSLVADSEIKAAIIDVRDNLGGDVPNLDYLISCFIDGQMHIGYNQTKMGLGRYDLGPKVTYNIGPVFVDYEGQKRDIPIVVLTDIWSASASEITAIAVRHLPQGYVVGERTFGATCALYPDFGLFYSGSFGDSKMDANRKWIGHGHYVYTPKYLFSDTDGTYYEGRGITPDKECLFDKAAWDGGIDNQLECAIEFAKSKIDYK